MPQDDETTLAPRAAAPAEVVLPPIAPKESPVAVYLARLSEGSRRTMHGSLDTIARLAVPGASAATFAWWQLRYAQTQVLRDRIVTHCPAPATARKHLSALRGILTVCSHLQGHTPDGREVRLLSVEDLHDALQIKNPIGVRVPHGRVLTPAERRALRAAAAAGAAPLAAARDSALVALAFETGLRRAEFAAVDLGGVGPSALRVVGKRNKERELPLMLSAPFLGAWTALLRADAAARGLTAAATWPLFCALARGGGIAYQGLAPRRLSVNGVERILFTIGQRAGLKHFTPHDTRRTFASEALDAGVGLGEVRDLMGHDSADTTLLYDPRAAEKRRAAIARVAAKLRGDE